MLHSFDFFLHSTNESFSASHKVMLVKEKEEENVDRLKGVQVLFDQLKREKKKLYSFFSFAQAISKDLFILLWIHSPVKCHQHKCARSDLPFIWIKWKCWGRFSFAISISLFLSRPLAISVCPSPIYEYTHFSNTFQIISPERLCNWTDLRAFKCNEY